MLFNLFEGECECVCALVCVSEWVSERDRVLELQTVHSPFSMFKNDYTGIQVNHGNLLNCLENALNGYILFKANPTMIRDLNHTTSIYFVSHLFLYGVEFTLNIRNMVWYNNNGIMCAKRRITKNACGNKM